VATIKEYARAGLLDEMHVPQVPVLLGAGERVFDGDAFAGYEVVEFVASAAVAHYRLARKS
jgi:dihydrofolate reductase